MIVSEVERPDYGDFWEYGCMLVLVLYVHWVDNLSGKSLLQ